MGRRQSMYHSTPMSERATKRRMTVLGQFYLKRDKVELKPIKNDKLLIELYKPKVMINSIGGETVPSTTNYICIKKPIHQLTDLEVYNKFQPGFPKYASVFVKQEIDGEALLLLRRKDVMRFILPIGPKVRLWCAIRKFIDTGA